MTWIGILIVVIFLFVFTTSVVVVAASMNSSRISARERIELAKKQFDK